MAERRRSNDGSRDTDKVPDAKGKVSQAGRSDGALPRDIGSRDERKRAEERPAGATRVRKSDKTGGEAGDG
ncbi:hypothetical protein [Roseicyclus sp.]|uniref:hypothetical protein n=1 Tax=Roseicyclus sp. TaxID=1914329 RepID=UPI003FA12E4A